MIDPRLVLRWREGYFVDVDESYMKNPAGPGGSDLDGPILDAVLKYNRSIDALVARGKRDKNWYARGPNVWVNNKAFERLIKRLKEIGKGGLDK